MERMFLLLAVLMFAQSTSAQKVEKVAYTSTKSVSNTEKTTLPDSNLLASIDTVTYNIQLREVPIYTWRNKDEQMEFLKAVSRVRKVMPYVKVARQLYANLQMHKEEEKKRTFRKYRKDLEKEMRANFEKELKDLTVGQGKVLVKLINRETGDNCYEIIKDVKGGFAAFGWQIVAKHYDYNLKEKYDAEKDWILERAIKSLGKEYDVSIASDVVK